MAFYAIKMSDWHDEDHSDTQPIIQEDPEVQEIRSRKWPIIGAILALTSSLIYAFNGLLIKTFQLDFVDTLFVRSVL